MIKRFVLWFLFLVVLPAGLLVSHWSALSIDSDIRRLLPDYQGDQLAVSARQQLASTLEGLVFIAIGHQQAEQARQAAEMMQASLKQSPLFDAVYLDRTDQGKALARSLYPYRYVRLTEQQRQHLALQDNSVWANSILQQLWSPGSAISSQLLVDDPLFLFPSQLSGLMPKTNATLSEQGYLIHQDSDTYWVLLELRTSTNVFSPSEQQQLMTALTVAQARLDKQFVGLQQLNAGILFHAQQAASQAKQEMSTIGVASLVLIFVLLLVVYRSMRPLALASLAIASGVLLAFSVMSVVFGRVHLLTFVFGASLIGVAIDYAFHFCAEHAGSQRSAQQSLAYIRPALLLSVLSTVAAYLTMALVPMDGIRQMAVFCAVGLLGSAVSLYLLAPILGRRMQAPPRWFKVSIHRPSWGKYYLLLVVPCLCGCFYLFANDDIRQLRGGFAELEQQEQQLSSLFSSGQSNQFFLIRGRDDEQILQREQALLQRLSQEESAVEQAWGLSRLVPSMLQQNRDVLDLERLYRQHLPSLLDEVGLDSRIASKSLAAFLALKDQRLYPKDLLSLPGTEAFRHLWLEQQTEHASLVTLFGVKDLARLATIADEFSGVSFVDPVGEMSLALSHFRVLANQLLLGVLLMVCVVLTWRLGIKAAMRCLLVPLLAGSLALGVLGWCGQGLSLFHTLALLLVFGVSLDYALFYHFSQPQSRLRLELATTSAAASTLLAFGLLAFSSTPALQGFGLTVLVGVAASYILAPQLKYHLSGDTNES